MVKFQPDKIPENHHKFLLGAKKSIKTDPMLVHSVYFFLKETVSDTEKPEFGKSVEALATIESVHAFFLGTPAATPDRPIIEKGYAFGMTILFQSMEDHNIYQDHPIHQAFIRNNKRLWEKVVIYDAES